MINEISTLKLIWYLNWLGKVRLLIILNFLLVLIYYSKQSGNTEPDYSLTKHLTALCEMYTQTNASIHYLREFIFDQ